MIDKIKKTEKNFIFLYFKINIKKNKKKKQTL